MTVGEGVGVDVGWGVADGEAVGVLLRVGRKVAVKDGAGEVWGMTAGVGATLFSPQDEIRLAVKTSPNM